MHTLSFQNHFFSQTMHQFFNTAVMNFESDESEPALRKWPRASGKL